MPGNFQVRIHGTSVSCAILLCSSSSLNGGAVVHQGFNFSDTVMPIPNISGTHKALHSKKMPCLNDKLTSKLQYFIQELQYTNFQTTAFPRHTVTHSSPSYRIKCSFPSTCQELLQESILDLRTGRKLFVHILTMETKRDGLRNKSSRHFRHVPRVKHNQKRPLLSSI